MAGPKAACVDPRILEGARQAAAAGGWRAATLAGIAEAAGVSRMTLHRRGIDRAAVRQALIESIEDAYREVFWPILTAPGSGRDRLEQALLAECEVEGRYPGIGEALTEAEWDESFHERGDEVMSREVYVAPLRRILIDGQADGTLRVVDPEETATVLFNLVSWTYRHLRSGHRWNHERAATAVVQVALCGVVA